MPFPDVLITFWLRLTLYWKFNESVIPLKRNIFDYIEIFICLEPIRIFNLTHKFYVNFFINFGFSAKIKFRNVICVYGVNFFRIFNPKWILEPILFYIYTLLMIFDRKFWYKSHKMCLCIVFTKFSLYRTCSYPWSPFRSYFCRIVLFPIFSSTFMYFIISFILECIYSF